MLDTIVETRRSDRISHERRARGGGRGRAHPAFVGKGQDQTPSCTRHLGDWRTGRMVPTFLTISTNEQDSGSNLSLGKSVGSEASSGYSARRCRGKVLAAADCS